jgi:xylan 1,4-beta-xylosidase
LFLPEEAGSPKTFAVHFTGVKAGKVRVTIVDKEHGSPLPAYEKMGSPRFPSRQQIETLRKTAAMPAAEEQILSHGEMKLTLQPHSLALIEVAN